MKKMVKKITNTLLSLMVMFSAFFFTSISANAEENIVNTNQESSSVSCKTFIPFRSDYVNYLSKYSYTKSDVTQYIWLKLFNEELNWNTGMSWYSPNIPSWSDKYYNDFVTSEGTTMSSKGMQATYNPLLDAYLYQTVITNPEFVINWLNENPMVFCEYSKVIKDHPVFAQSIIELTANGKYLGDGKDSPTNVFLFGANATSTDKLNAKWVATATTTTTNDISVLRILGRSYKSLNQLQKDWVITYLEFLVNDYITNRSNAIGAYSNSKELYELMAISGYGFTRGEVNHEFFNYCINTPTCSVGDLIKNSMDRYNKSSELRFGSEDITKFSDMGAIWASDADCDYGNSWPGGRSSGTNNGDEDYDWLCWNICFNNDTYYSTLRNLVEGHPTTNKQMEDWLTRYYTSPSNPNRPIIPSGQQTFQIGKWGIGGCHLNLPGLDTGASWDCSGHSDTSGAIRATKPVGAKSITLTCNGQTYQQMYGQSLSYVVRNAYGQVVKSGSAQKGYWSATASINVPTKYIWQELYIEAHGTVEQGHKGHNSGGGCISSAMVEWLHGGAPGLFPDPPKYHTMNVTYTYVDITACQRNGHSYRPAAYSWANDHSHCICTMQCPNCGDKYTLTSTNVSVTEHPDRYVYTASFGMKCVDNNDETASQRSTTVYKGSGAKVFASNELSGHPTGIAFGSCSLEANKISAGPQTISVSVYATDGVVILMNKYGEKVDQCDLSTGSSAISNLQAVFDLSDKTNRELDGLYIVINAQTIVKNYNSIGNYIGNAFGPYNVDSITITY